MKHRLREDALHVLVLWAFAVAQPLYDLLGRSPTFFVYHRSRTIDFALFVVLISLAAPLLVAGIAHLVGLLLPLRFRSAPAHVAATVLAAAIAFPALIGVVDVGPGLVLAVALTAGTGFAVVRARHRGTARFLSFLAPVSLLFPALFLFRPGLPAQWLPVAPAEALAAAESSQTPVLFVIFDALPVHTLLTAEGSIDGERYPNFARLAAQSDWYPNATTVANSTEFAVPSILTGRCPNLGHPAPVFAAHPNNLFTWLGGGRSLQVAETVTALCPETLCGSGEVGLFERSTTLWRDSLYVYLHRLLPAKWVRGVPRVDTTWGGFGDGGESRDRGQRTRKPGQIEAFRQSLADLVPSEEPLLYFVHLGVPHEPYLYLPTGQRYREGEEPAGTTATFGDDPLVPLHSLQRHLLQVGLADRLLGELLDQLDRSGLGAEALLVVLSDHGTSFLPGLPRREVVPGNAAEVLAVPLFVKRPGQTVGRVFESRVQTVDVLPMIASALELPVPPWVDGRPPAQVEEAGSLSCTPGETLLPEVPPREVAAAGERTRELFAADPAFPTVAVEPDLLQRPAARLLCEEPGGLGARLERPELFENVDPEGSFVPAEIVGSWSGGELGEPALAVAVNGTVRATTRPYRLGEDASPLWSAVVPPTSFVEGRNRVEVFEIVDGPGCRLRSSADQGEVSLLDRRLGVFPIPGVRTVGLEKRRELEGEFVRWSHGRALIDVELSSDDLPRVRALTVSIAAVRPGGVSLRVRVAGRRVLSEDVTRGPWSRTIALSAGELRSPVRIELRSPTQEGERGAETIALEGIWLSSRTPEPSGR